MTEKKAVSSRFLTLDYVRGFFIAFIVIDHLWRWPSLFEYMTGRGELWTSSAEGFIIISGLLVGYVRGHKNRREPFRVTSGKLIRRGIMLYVWAIITTIILAAVTWYFADRGAFAYVPYARYDWQSLIVGTFSLQYTHTLTHFLYLYALYLVASPLVVWMLRQGHGWLVALLSLGLWWVGYSHQIESLQWQILFFVPSIIGFWLDPLLARLASLSTLHRRLLIGSVCFVAVGTFIWSAVTTLPLAPGTVHSTLFTREPLSLPTILISFVWFAAIVAAFSRFQPYIHRTLGWLLLPIGTRSLTAYILHSIPMMVCSILIVGALGFWANTFLTILCILVTWALVSIPHVNRVIPR